MILLTDGAGNVSVTGTPPREEALLIADLFREQQTALSRDQYRARVPGPRPGQRAGGPSGRQLLFVGRDTRRQPLRDGTSGAGAMSDTGLRLGRRQQLAADGLLLLVTAIWGSTFVMVKDAVATYPVFPFLALRFSLGLVALLLIGWRKLRYSRSHRAAWPARWPASSCSEAMLFRRWGCSTRPPRGQDSLPA